MKAGENRPAKYFKYIKEAPENPQYAHIYSISHTIFLFPFIISLYKIPYYTFRLVFPNLSRPLAAIFTAWPGRTVRSGL